MGDSCIGGIAAEDVDGDGLGGPSSDIGIPAVSVTMFDGSGVAVGTTLTDSNGCFAFDTTGFGTFLTGENSWTVAATNVVGGFDSDLDGGDPNVITFTTPGGGVDPSNHCLWFLDRP